MARHAQPVRSNFHTLRFMTALKAARDFGLEPEPAAAIASRFDPRRPNTDQIVEALATELVESGAVGIPEAA